MAVATAIFVVGGIVGIAETTARDATAADVQRVLTQLAPGDGLTGDVRAEDPGTLRGDTPTLLTSMFSPWSDGYCSTVNRSGERTDVVIWGYDRPRGRASAVTWVLRDRPYVLALTGVGALSYGEGDVAGHRVRAQIAAAVHDDAVVVSVAQIWVDGTSMQFDEAPAGVRRILAARSFALDLPADDLYVQSVAFTDAGIDVTISAFDVRVG